MAARIVHFGNSDCGRLLVLAAKGYDVHDCGNSLVHLEESLRQRSADAVVFSEDGAYGLMATACDISIALSPAPRILFSDRLTNIPRKNFHAVIEPLTAPNNWLEIVQKTIEQTKTLIMQSREQREQSSQMRDQSAELRSKSREEQARSRRLTSEGDQK